MFTRRVDVGVAVRDKAAAISKVIMEEEKKKNRLKGVSLIDDSTVQLTFADFFKDYGFGRIVRPRQFPKDRYATMQMARRVVDDEGVRQICRGIPNRRGLRPYWGPTVWEIELPDVYVVFAERKYAG